MPQTHDNGLAADLAWPSALPGSWPAPSSTRTHAPATGAGFRPWARDEASLLRDSRPDAPVHSVQRPPQPEGQAVPRVLCIYLPALALEAYTRDFPARRRSALAITSAPGPTGHVLCANACARAAGVVPGLRNAQASGLSEAIELVGYPAAEVAALCGALNQALYQHTPQLEWLAERRPPHSHDAGASGAERPWATSTGAAVLWAGLDGLGADLRAVLHTVRQLLAICTDFDLSWRAALGFHRYHTLASSLDAGELKVFATPEAALLDAKRTSMDALLQAWTLPTHTEARAAGHAKPTRQALGAQQQRAQAPKPQTGGVSSRGARQRATQWLLAKLKVESLGEFMLLSPHAVRMGLGANAHRMQCALLEADAQPIATYLPPTEARFGLDFEPNLTHFQEAYPALQPQLATLLARLFKHSRTLTGLQLTLKQADHPAHASTLRLAEPTLNVARVMALVTVHCETLVLKSPLTGLEVCAEHVPFAWVQTQLLEEAFEGDARPKVARASVLRALDRITALYGHQSFQRAALVPAHPPEARFTWDAAKPVAATGPQRAPMPSQRARPAHSATPAAPSAPERAVIPLAFERLATTQAEPVQPQLQPAGYPAGQPAEDAAPVHMLRRLLPRPWPLPSSLSEALWQRVHAATHPGGDTSADAARGVRGPFRLSDRWWERTALRDYYYLRTDDESWLWLFRERVTGRWYLHGWLD